MATGRRARWEDSGPMLLAALFSLGFAQNDASAQSTGLIRDETEQAQQDAEPVKDEEMREMGAPDSVQKQLEAQRRARGTLYEFGALKPYYDWKQHIYEVYGYSFGATYYAVALKASDSLPGTDDDASGGVFRYYGQWELLGRGTDAPGSLVYLIEHRDSYSDNLPGEFSFDSLGNVGAIEIPFTDDGWHLTNLFWAQAWDAGRFEAWAGWLDVTDYVDVYPLTSPWNDFFNFAFSIGAGSIDLPDDAAMGVAAGAWLTPSTYVVGGFNDLNSDPTDPGDSFDTFFNDHEYFSFVEIGRTTFDQEQYYLDNIHLTLWHADERDDLGVDDGWGAFGSYTRSLADNWLCFARGGFAEDGGSLLERTVSVGASFHEQPIGLPGNQLGFGFNWGQPNDSLFGSDLDDQYAAEVYYRLQVSREIAITPDLQLLIDPALFPDEDTIWVAGLRASFGL